MFQCYLGPGRLAVLKEVAALHSDYPRQVPLYSHTVGLITTS